MVEAAGGRGFGRAARRLAYMIALALGGLVVSRVIEGAFGVHPRQIADSAAYSTSVAALLAVGLYASVYGISRRELRANAGVVLAAVTVGVTAKAFASGAVMMLAFGGAGYLLLGVAVAQIDPLSVAASLRDRRMSPRARSVLSAWASFDDPVTVLLVAYLAGATLPGVRGASVLAGTGGVPGQFALNGALVAGAGAAWYLLGLRRHGPWASPRDSGRANAAACLVLAGLMAVAVGSGLFAGIAVCGLFFRPRIDAIVGQIVNAAFYAATFGLGMLLVTGVRIGAGVLLGVSVFGAQVLAGVIISRGMPREDRARLALGQQNGVTAIVLALALAPYFPAAVGTIAIAIGVVNILHILGNGAWDLMGSAITRPVREPSVTQKISPRMAMPRDLRLMSDGERS